MLTTLPPSPRDFEIHRLHCVEFLSTRQLAEKFRISQTRVRQIIAHAADWLTEMLPLKSEQDIEKEKRYAIHLAAAQLQHQIQQLKNYWDGSGDPKYLRQQTRAIQALARLGAPSHSLDSLAANVVPSLREGDEPEPTLKPANERATNSTKTSGSAPPHPLSISSSTDSSFATSHSAPHPSPSDHRPLTSDPSSCPPPSEDCSPQSSQASSLEPQAFPSPAATPSPEHDLLLQPEIARDTLKGLDIQEQRLLTLIDETYPAQTERRQRLQETLADLRQSRANFILRLGRNTPVTAVTTERQSPPPVGEDGRLSMMGETLSFAGEQFRPEGPTEK